MKSHEGSGFTLTAAEDIPGGFGRKGWSLYGDCRRMHVVSYTYNSKLDVYDLLVCV